MCNKMHCLTYISTIFFGISYLLFLVINILIVSKGNKLTDFEFLYYCSKLISVKKLVKNNHNNEIFQEIDSNENLVGIASNYKELLQFTTKDGCIENYKQCGILDTVGNKLCIEEIYECPINKMKVDMSIRKDNYLSQGYKVGNLRILNNSNLLYYSNLYTNESASIMILKSNEIPKYLTINNFFIDKEIYDRMFGFLSFLSKGKDSDEIFSNDNNDNNDKNNKNDGQIENMISIGSSADSEIELIIKSISYLISYASYQIEKFKNFIEKKIEEDEDNIDIYFKNIGNNVYTKNYIGFGSIEDLNKFMKFDFNIYKKKFPNYTSYIFFIIGIIFSIIAIGILILNIFIKMKYTHFICSFIYLIFFLGFFIYTIISFLKLYKNNDIEKLKSIKSDEFIEKFLKEFINKIDNTTLLIWTIGVFSSSFVFNLFGIIFYLFSLKIYSDETNILFK